MRRQDLDGDGAPKLRIVGAVHLSHASGAEQRVDLVRPDPATGLERQPWQGHRNLAEIGSVAMCHQKAFDFAS